jgi:hypothetical protein
MRQAPRAHATALSQFVVFRQRVAGAGGLQ